MPQPHTPTTKPKADIDFEKELWDVANELRGAVAENQYKDYVLSLLFLKHLSERYEIRKTEIQLSFLDPESDYYNIDAQEQSYVLDDELEYQVKNVYRLPVYIKQKPRRPDGEHSQRQPEVLFIDARKLGQMASRRLRVFHDEDITKIADTYHQWRNLNGNYTDIDGFCKAANLTEIEANNFMLSPGPYVGSEAEETDGVPFAEKIALLTAELAAQFEEGAELETKIRKNLKRLNLDL